MSEGGSIRERPLKAVVFSLLTRDSHLGES